MFRGLVRKVCINIHRALHMEILNFMYAQNQTLQMCIYL